MTRLLGLILAVPLSAALVFSFPPGCADISHGNAAATEEIVYEFSVEGMSCEGCVFAVRSAVTGLDGVSSCSVSLEDGIAVVTVSDEAAEQAIIDAVTDLKFTVTRRN